MAEKLPAIGLNDMGKQSVKASMPKKMSFASVAAMAPKSIVSQKVTDLGEKAPLADSGSLLQSPPLKQHSSEKLDQDLVEPMSGLGIKDDTGLVPDLSDPDIRNAIPGGSGLDDEKTQLSVSSTKAPSVDDKSTASGLTFEKESLRPEDSASVKAAEDEDSNSGPGSGAQNSLTGSETGGKAFHNQLQEISVQRGLPLARRLALGSVDDSRKGILQLPNAMNVVPPSVRTDTGMPAVPQFQQAYHEPDPKLLEALESPKDRLFLLQLEQQFIAFIQNSQEHTLDLPPCNSFCRLLAHRLGDYYRLPHFVDNSVTWVRLYKSQTNQLPTPLSAFSRGAASEEAPNTQPSMKIMRRAGMGSEGPMSESGANTATSSVAPSKPSSEAGEDGQKASRIASPTESSVTKDKASQRREEKEAKYKEARDRIFADWKEEQNAESLQATEVLNDVSRASSANGKKKKKNKNDDDEFQARSAYSIIYSNSARQATTYDQSTAQMGYYNPYMQSNGQMPQPGYTQPYSQPFQQMAPMQGYPMQAQPPGPMPQAPMFYPQNGVQQPYMTYPPQQSPSYPGQYYPQTQQRSQIPPPHPAMPSPLNTPDAQLFRPQPQMSDQNWGQHNYQSPYQGFSNPQSSYQPQGLPIVHTPQMNGMPVPYQVPFQPNMQGGRAPQPHRQNFNPQTRSFVPGLGNMSTPPNPYGGRVGHSSSFQGVNMHTNFHHAQMPPVPPSHLAPPFSSHGTSSPRKAPSQAPQSQSPGTSTLSKWGTPSTLPPKPPPPASPRISSNGSTLGTQSMPTFQNGTYSKPSISPQEAKAS